MIRIIKTRIEVANNRIVVFQPQKGTVADASNIGIFDKETNRPYAFGIQEEEFLKSLSFEDQNEVRDKIFATPLFSEEGIENGFAWLALEYYLYLAASPDLLIIPLITSVDLALNIEDYDKISSETRFRFECSLASHLSIRTATVNGKKLSKLKTDLAITRWARYFCYLSFLIPIVWSLLIFSMQSSGTGPASGFSWTALIFGSLAFGIAGVSLYYFVVLGSTLVWVLALRFFIPWPVVKIELDHIESPPNWFKRFLLRMFL